MGWPVTDPRHDQPTIGRDFVDRMVARRYHSGGFVSTGRLALKPNPQVEKWDRRFLEMAALVGTWSKDPSTKVGAVIVRADRTVASVGFNGFPRGMRDDEHLYADRELKYSRTVHAEVNAILAAQEPVRGCTLYLSPFMPCDRCAVQVIQAGIRRVVTLKATDEQNERWGKAFETTRQMLTEAGVCLVEMDA